MDEEGRRTSLVVEGQEEGHSKRLLEAQGRSSRQCMARRHRREAGSRSSCFRYEDRRELGKGARNMANVECKGRFGGWDGWDSCCPASEEAVSVLYSYKAKGQRGG